MGIFARVQTLIKAHANELVDKAIDMNSIPVLNQYGRELEEALEKTKHEAAVASAHVTTLNSQATALQTDIDSNTARGKAFMAKNPPDEANAKLAAEHIHDSNAELTDIKSQIESAKVNAAAMIDAKSKLQIKYQQTVSQLRMLESRDSSTRAKEQSTAALKDVERATSGSSTVSIDSLSEKIRARGDVADEEFNETVAEVTPPPDPVRDEAVNSIMDSFQEKQPSHA
jgi:phage shock protein A